MEGFSLLGCCIFLCHRLVLPLGGSNGSIASALIIVVRGSSEKELLIIMPAALTCESSSYVRIQVVVSSVVEVCGNAIVARLAILLLPPDDKEREYETTNPEHTRDNDYDGAC